MKALLQRVNSASVTIDGEIHSSIGKGFLILFGVGRGDDEEDCRLLCEKIVKFRVFADENGKMNRSVVDVGGEILVVSQFTLCADVKKGSRPSFIGAAEPCEADRLYNLYCDELLKNGVRKVEKGVFGAHMEVELLNNGPVTILYDTEMWRGK